MATRRTTKKTAPAKTTAPKRHFKADKAEGMKTASHDGANYIAQQLEDGSYSVTVTNADNAVLYTMRAADDDALEALIG